MRSDLSVVRGMRIFSHALAAFFFIFCFFSCACAPSPVVYEIVIPTDIYAGLSDEGFFERARITQFYSEKVAREVFSSDKYSVILIDEAAFAVSPKEKPDNVFVLAKVSYTEVMSEAFGSAIGTVNASSAGDVADSGLSAEIARTYYYPCVPFDEDVTMPFFDADAEFANDAENAGTADTTPEFYKLSDIPMGYVMLPVRANGAVFHADSPDYPIYESKLLKCDFFAVEGAQDAVKVCAALFNEELVPLVKQEPEAHPDVFFMAAVGDIILSRGVQDAMFYADSPDPVFTDTIPILKNNDFTIGNLEGAVTARTENAQKTYTFKFKKAALPYLKEVGFDYLMLTNNHCYDYGELGFKDTLQAVAAAGFATSGAGLDKNEAMNFYRTTLNGHAVSVLSFGAYPVEQSGFNGKTMAAATKDRAGILWESDEVLDMIREEKKTGALIIVNIHGGSEYVTKPTKSQRTLYEKVCDAGADVIFGSHPHVLQPIEWYGNSLIVWSLGNFVFPGMDEMPGATDTMIVRLGFVDGRLLYYEKYPAYIDNTAVRLKK